MQIISKGFYMGSIFGGMVLSLVLMFSAGWMATAQPDAAGGILFFAWIPMLFAIVMWYVLTYKMWAALPAGFARTSPGKAVGFMFIPFFNIYWLFQVWVGWAKDYNRVVSQHGLPGLKMSEGLPLTFCILILVCVVPLVNILAGLALIVVQIMLVNQVIDAVNGLTVQLNSMSRVPIPEAQPQQQSEPQLVP